MYNRNDHRPYHRDQGDNGNYRYGRRHPSDFRRADDDEPNAETRRYDYRNDDEDYSPFSNIYDDHAYRRQDFDTRYNEPQHYYYNNDQQNDRSDEARGQSLSDVFRGGRRRSENDRDYFTAYRSGGERGSDPHYSLYGSGDEAYRHHHHHDEDREQQQDWRRQAQDHSYDRGRGDYRHSYGSGQRYYTRQNNGYGRSQGYNDGYLY